MRSVDLGLSGVKSSVLAYGAMRIAGTWDKSKFSKELEEVGRHALITAWENGYTLFDHADIYAHGECEAIHGRLLKEVPTMREEILLATKCGIRWAGDPDESAPHRYDFSKEHILWSCEQSLQRLGVETIDLYQLHRPDVLMNPEEVTEAFFELRSSGKVRWFGVSNFSPSFVSCLQSYLDEPLICNQVEIHLGRLDCFTDGTLDQCLAHQMSPLSWSPIGGGWLASDTAPEDESKRDLWNVIGDIALKYACDRATVCVSFLTKHPSNIIPIIGSTKPERIVSAAKGSEVELSREDWYLLYTVARGKNLP